MRQLDTFRMTQIRYPDGSEFEIVDRWDEADSHRPVMDEDSENRSHLHWTGSTTFRHVDHAKPARRLRGKQPLIRSRAEQHIEQLPPPTLRRQQRRLDDRPTSTHDDDMHDIVRFAKQYDDDEDRWERQGTTWIRHHVVPRAKLFVPTDEPNGPDPAHLTPARETHYRLADCDTDELTTRRDVWNTGDDAFDRLDLSHENMGLWIGRTIFFDLDTPLADSEYTDLARNARMLPTPLQPTANEIQIHNLTHLPFRSWCEVCVQARGKSDHHRKATKPHGPTIQVDFSFLGTSEDEKVLPVLVAIDIQTGLTTACLSPTKGKVKYLAFELKMFCIESGRTYGTIQSDNETTIKAIAQRAIKDLNGMAPRTTPKHDSQSNAFVERAHQSIRDSELDAERCRGSGIGMVDDIGIDQRAVMRRHGVDGGRNTEFAHDLRSRTFDGLTTDER